MAKKKEEIKEAKKETSKIVPLGVDPYEWRKEQSRRK